MQRSLVKLMSVLIIAAFLVSCSGQSTTVPEPAAPQAPAAEESAPSLPETEAPAAEEPAKVEEPAEAQEPAEEESVVQKKELIFAGPTDISSMDPRNATGTNTATILAHVFSSLVKTDANGAIVNDLAESYQNIDDVTWEFKLKEGITFHDGSPLSSADVKYTMDTIRDPEKKYRLASDFSFMTVEIIDDLNFKIITDAPFAALLLRLNYVKIIPKAYVENVGDEAFAQAPIGSGPYKFVEWQKDDKVVIEAYDEYFGGRPAIDVVTYRVIPEDASRIAALESGEVDIIANVATSQVSRLEEKEGIEVVGSPTTRVVFVSMNTLIESPLQDPKVRQAINYAVDKEALIQGVLDGYAKQVATISTPEYEGFDPSITPFEYDVQKAKDLLAEAGYPDGFPLDFSVTVGLLNSTDVVQVIAAQLSEVGIECNVIVEDSAQQREKIAAGTVEPLYLQGIGGPYSNIDLIAKLVFSTGERYSTYSNPDFDALRLQAASEVDLEKANALNSQLQQMLKDLAPAIFLYQQYSLYGVNTNRVVNWVPRVDEMVVVIDADVK